MILLMSHWFSLNLKDVFFSLFPTHDSKLTISTHNINGYCRSKEFLRAQCHDTPNSIPAFQEHWLRPSYKKQAGVNQLRCLHPDFDGYGTSAMKHSSETQVMNGRPFGGTGFLYNKKYAKCLRPLVHFQHERVSVMEMNTKQGGIIIINAYMPYHNSRDLLAYTALYQDTIGYIDNILHSFQGYQFIITADLNCNIFDPNHTYTAFVTQLMSKYDLVSTFDLMPNFDCQSSFTRYDLKTKSYTLIDGILVSKTLVPNVSNVRIGNYGNNVSDHVPVELDLTVQIREVELTRAMPRSYVNWNKLSDDSKRIFRQTMADRLASINVDYNCIIHGDCCCPDDEHKVHLENYYCDIMSAVIEAESVLPKSSPSFQRSFWSEELDELKRNSIDCCNNWKNIGCPLSGPAYNCKRNCYYSYKIALRRSKANDAKCKRDDLYSNLVDKDGISFWKSWNSLNKSGNTVSSRIDGETDKSNCRCFCLLFRICVSESRH